MVGELPRVVGVTTLLAVLVDALVSNAVRFAGEGPPRLRVFGERKDGFVELHFEDQGMGMPEGRERAVFAVLQNCHADSGVGAGFRSANAFWLPTEVASVWLMAVRMVQC